MNYDWWVTIELQPCQVDNEENHLVRGAVGKFSNKIGILKLWYNSFRMKQLDSYVYDLHCRLCAFQVENS